jgi:hypothetical protein
MADLLGTDEFLVNRDNVTYTQEQATLMANLESDDLLLINRDDVTYTITGSDLTGSIIDPLSVTVVISPTSGYINVEHTANPVASGGKAPTGGYVYTYQWIIADDANGTNATNLAGETNSTYTPVSSQLGKYLGCTCGTTDALGTSASGTGYVGPITQPEVAVDIDDVVLTQNQTNANRFTSNSFTTTVTYTETPSPTQSVEMTAKVVGALGIEAGTDVITSNGYTGTASTSVPLTLNSNIYLTDGTFEVDDVVEASASYTPETDTINKVDNVLVDVNVTQGTPGAQLRCRGGGCAFTSSTFNQDVGFESPGGSFDVTFDPPLNGNIGIWSIRSEDPYTVTLKDSNGDTITNVTSKASPGTYGECFVFQAGVQSDVAGMFMNNTSANDSVLCGVTVDDVVLVDGVDTGTRVLSLSGSKDIELFQVDDVVGNTETFSPNSTQQVYYVNGVVNGRQFKTPESDPGNAFDGNSGTRCQSGSPNEENGIGMVWPTGASFGGTAIKIKLATNGTIRFVVNEDWDTPIPTEGTLPTGVVFEGNDTFDITSFVAARGQTLKSVYVYSTAGTMGVNGFNNGNGWISQSYGTKTLTDVKVTATDVSAKTITVNGGNWDDSNQSQVWSNGATLGTGNIYSDGGSIDKVPERIFDGDDSTSCVPEKGTASNSVELNLAISLADVTKIRVRGSSMDRCYVNDGNSVPSTTNGWNTIYDGAAISLTSLKIERTSGVSGGGSTTGFAVSGVEINGKLLVDAVNDSQVWSEQTTSNFLSGYKADKAFNGVLDGNDGCIGNSQFTFDFTDLTVNSTLRFWGSGTNGSFNLVLDGQVLTPFLDGDQWHEIDLSGVSLPADFTQMNSIDTSVIIAGVEVDGKLLFDQGIRNLGDNKVSTVSAKQGKGTISDITGSVVTIDPYTDNCFKEGQYLTHATTKNIQITPLSDSIDSVSGDTLTLTGSKDLVNFSSGDAVTMANADGTAASYTPVSDSIVSVSGTAPAITLTLSGDKDLAYFRPGDVVQPGDLGNQSFYDLDVNDRANWSDGDRVPAHLWDGRIDTYCSPKAGLEFTGDFTSIGGIPVTGHLYISESGISEDQDLKVNNIAIRPNYTLVNGNDPDGNVVGRPFWKVPAADIGNKIDTIYFFRGNSGNGAQTAAWWDDNGWILGGTDVKVVSTSKPGDANHPSITVDGGDWAVDSNLPVYADDISGENGISSGTAQNAFDGDTTTYCSAAGVTSRLQSTVKWTFDAAADGLAGDVRVYVKGEGVIQDGADNEIGTYSATGWVTLSGDITSMSNAIVVRAAAGEVAAVAAYEVDGVVVLGRTPGDTEVTGPAKSGTGTVSSRNPANNTITLSTNNDEWMDGYYVKGPLKNRIEKTAYLKFDASGTVEEISRLPQAAVTMTASDPVLTFPAQFGTGDAPDTELANPTALQTEITAKNTFSSGTVNTDTQASNSLYPQTNNRSVPASGEKRTTAEGLAQFIANVDTFSGRQAAANTDPTDATSIYNAKLLEINEELE